MEAAISSEAEPKCGSPGEADGYKDTLQKSIQVKIKILKILLFDEKAGFYMNYENFYIQHNWLYKKGSSFFVKWHLDLHVYKLYWRNTGIKKEALRILFLHLTHITQ